MNNKHGRMIFLFLTTAILLTSCAQPNETEETIANVPNLEDSDQKIAYAIGVSTAKSITMSLEALEGTDITVNIETLTTGFVDGANDKAKLDDDAIEVIMNDLRARMTIAMQEKRRIGMESQNELAESNKSVGAVYLTQNKANPDVTTLDSGLQYQVLTAGNGKSPGLTDRVKVHYQGTLIDGSQFDSSYDRGEPAVFGVNQVISGWTEALQLMKEGAKWQLTIPAELAYGPTARPTIPGNSVLLFDVELLEVVE